MWKSKDILSSHYPVEGRAVYIEPDEFAEFRSITFNPLVGRISVGSDEAVMRPVGSGAATPRCVRKCRLYQILYKVLCNFVLNPLCAAQVQHRSAS